MKIASCFGFLICQVVSCAFINLIGSFLNVFFSVWMKPDIEFGYKKTPIK